MICVTLQNPYQYQDIPSNEDISHWVNSAWQDKLNAEVVVRVVDKAEIQQLNANYRHKDKPTNVLSFPSPTPPPAFAHIIDEIDEEPYAGDMVICHDVLHEEAQQQKKTLQQHWAHLLIHSALHLQGYDHETDSDAEVMEALEVKTLQALGFPDPYEKGRFM